MERLSEADSRRGEARMTKERKEETNPAIKQAKEVTTNKSSSTSSLYQEEEMMVQSPEKEEADARITYTRPQAVFPGGSDLMNTSRISYLLGQEGPKTVFIGPV